MNPTGNAVKEIPEETKTVDQPVLEVPEENEEETKPVSISPTPIPATEEEIQLTVNKTKELIEETLRLNIYGYNPEFDMKTRITHYTGSDGKITIDNTETNVDKRFPDYLESEKKYFNRKVDADREKYENELKMVKKRPDGGFFEYSNHTMREYVIVDEIRELAPDVYEMRFASINFYNLHTTYPLWKDNRDPFIKTGLFFNYKISILCSPYIIININNAHYDLLPNSQDGMIIEQDKYNIQNQFNVNRKEVYSDALHIKEACKRFH
jgi:hypothetical protein